MKKIKKQLNKTAREQVNILDITVDSTDISQVLTAVAEKVSHNIKFYITTPNPELILASTKNKKLKDALNNADFSIPDGVGLRTAVCNLNIIKGRVLFLQLVKLAYKNKWRVFFLGGLDNEAELAAKKLGARFAKGPILNNEAKPVLERDIKLQIDVIKKINEYRPHLLFVAFGNPKQEIWIYKNLSKLNIGGAMAVGGTFRYLSGFSKLPPKWMEKLGLEWVWRFLTEPKRIFRIFNAFPLFPIRVWIHKLKTK